jgi:hypothetical protein
VEVSRLSHVFGCRNRGHDDRRIRDITHRRQAEEGARVDCAVDIGGYCGSGAGGRHGVNSKCDQAGS